MYWLKISINHKAPLIHTFYIAYIKWLKDVTCSKIVSISAGSTEIFSLLTSEFWYTGTVC